MTIGIASIFVNSVSEKQIQEISSDFFPDINFFTHSLNFPHLIFKKVDHC